MRVLFDQNTPVRIAKYLKGHEIRTAYQCGWDTLTNGDLLRAAEAAGFDVLLTCDRNISYQQNLRDRQIAIVVVSRNRWSLIEPVIHQISTAVTMATPCSYIEIDIP